MLSSNIEIEKKLKYICLILAVVFSGCSDERKFIHYNYRGVTVTRINDYGTDYFYYGRFERGSKLPDHYILSKFSGLDGMMSAFLIFKKDKTVEIIPVADDFSQSGDNHFMRLDDEIENIDFIHWRDSTMHNLDSIIEVSDVVKSEITRNKAGQTKVRARYEKSLLEN